MASARLFPLLQVAWLVLFSLIAPAGAQDPLYDATAFRVADDAPEGLWVEFTPLRTPGGAPDGALPRTHRPAVLLPEYSQPGVTWLPDRAAGPAMLCVGVDAAARPDDPSETGEPWLWATRCELVALWRDDPESLLPPPDDPVVEISAATGPPVVGRYVLGDLPVAGAVLSVAPARLEAPAAFSVPLAWTSAGPGRRVTTADDGGFRLPRLASGDYVLEARLPGGRLHRSDEFTVPEVEDLQTNTGTLDFEQLVFDLGDLDVQVGVSLEVRAIAPDAGPVADVDVQLRQGRTPAELATFRVRTGDDGTAVLDGLTVEAHSVLTCSAPGLATVRHEWDLLPVTLDCDMEPLAALAGQVLDPELQAIPGTVVRLLPSAETFDAETSDAESARAHEAAVDEDGSFLFADVGEGDWTLEAAAPGFRVERLDVTLESGDRTLLDPIYLRPGREVLVRVSGPDGEPVPGAEIVAVDPPGAVAATADDDGEALFAHPGPETTIEVSGLEYAAERVVVPAETAGDAARGPFDVTLRPGGWIRVLVSLGTAEPEPAADGSLPWTPCAGCDVWILSPGAASRRLTTDGRGEALSPPLRPGIHRVQRSRLSAAGRTVIEQPGAEERTVGVAESEVTTVRFATGDGVLNLRFDPPPDPELGPWSLVVRSGGSRKVVPAESDGSYRLDVPGRRSNEVARGLPVSMSLLRFDGASDAEAWTKVAEFASWPAAAGDGSEDELVIPLPQGNVEGRALRTDTGAATAPAAGALVRLIGFHDFATVAELRTAPDGRFFVPHLAPGVYSVQIRDLIYTYVSLRPGQSYDVGPLRLAPGPQGVSLP